MPSFAYVVKDKAGQTHHGVLDTPSRQALIEQLWKQEFVVLSIEERQAKRARAFSPGGVKAHQLVVFSRQLATMIGSGIPIIGSLDALAEQMEDRNFRRILRRMRDDVEAGSSLSEALAKHPRAFSDFFLNMVRAGESSGRLDEILDRLANYLEKIDVMRRKVQASLYYPAVVTVLAMGITAFLVIFVVPKFKDIFASLGGQLPLATRLLLQVSDFMRHFLLLEIGLLIAAIIGFRMYIGTKGGRAWFDRVKLDLPVIGILLRKVAIARFARTLATLARAGVPILTAMEIVARTSGNKVIETAVMTARTSVREGENIADPLAQSKAFPPMVTRMISVGEKTGELEKMLSKVADFYESEVDAAVSGLTSLIEPLIIAFLGLVIGSIVIALFMPIFTITQLIQR
ncbi:MAG: type II secretion system F family protein [Candidatus Omnitrophica bacterium]|nr:type II secretion system F family protein [Candidatus Omnitrophota bacterium]